MRPRLILFLAVIVFAVWFALPSTAQQLVMATGEVARPSQLRALWNQFLNLARPQLQLAHTADIKYVHDVSPFGVNTFLEQEVEVAKREQTVQMIKESGFVWVRQQFPWADIEIDGKGDFTDRRNPPERSAWDKYDNIVGLTEKYGLKVIARLSAPPKWSHRGYADLGDFGPPAQFEDYADYVAAVVTRYKGRIQYYQLWNEPNIYPEWGDQRVNPEDYARMMCMAYDRAKAIDPNVVVLSAALAPTIAQDGRDLSDLIFLQRMYNAGAGRVSRTLAAKQATTFAKISPSLPVETRLYVPKIYATIALRTGVPPERLAEENPGAPYRPD